MTVIIYPGECTKCGCRDIRDNVCFKCGHREPIEPVEIKVYESKSHLRKVFYE